MDWVKLSISLLSILVIILLTLVIIMQSTSAKSSIKNGVDFPYKTTLAIKNKSGYDLKDVMISDSMGQSYTVIGNWNKNSTVYIYLPVYNNYGHLEIYAVDLTGVNEFNMQMVNIDNKVQLQYLYGTPTTSFIISTSNKTTNVIKPVYTYNNTIYQVDQDPLENGDEFPRAFTLFNNTTNGYVVDNSANLNGTNPNLDKIVVTELYVTDSLNHVYADAVSNTPITKSNKSQTGNLIQSTLLFRLPKNIPKGEYLQIYMKDANDNDYNIVLQNSNGTLAMTYSSNLDYSAFPILIVNTNSHQEKLCTSISPVNHEKPGQFSANFRPSALWPNGSTIKIGFMGGQPWMWYWTAKNIVEGILPWVNLSFNFVFPANDIPVAVLDSSYQIRIAFDPTQGAYSMMGVDSLTVAADKQTFNLGFLDIPYGTTFEYPVGSGKTYKSTATPIANTVNLNSGDIVQTVAAISVLSIDNTTGYDLPKGYSITVPAASPSSVPNLSFSINGAAFSIPKINFVYLPAGIYDQGWVGGTLGSTILHEMCHALGQQHEHTTPFNNPIIYDKEKTYKYYAGPPNNWTKEQVDGNVLAINNIKDTTGSDYDANSIMRYQVNTDLLVQPVPSDILTWANLHPYVLSDCDKFYLRKLYPGKELPTGVTSLACRFADHAAPTPPLVITN